MFLDEHRARGPKVVAGSAVQISTILYTSNYVAARALGPAEGNRGLVAIRYVRNRHWQRAFEV